MAEATVRLRKAAFAGSFYPAAPAELHALVGDLVQAGAPVAQAALAGRRPMAIVAPHGPYTWSGAQSGQAWAAVQQLRGTLDRVVLLGPSHRFAQRGFFVPESHAWLTPLGIAPLDYQAVSSLLTRPDVLRAELAHDREQSLELQVPFVQHVLGNVPLVPIAVGEVDAQVVAGILDQLWPDDRTLVVVSTDLASDVDAHTAKVLSAATARQVQALDGAALTPARCCGWSALAGLLLAARQRRLQGHTLSVGASAVSGLQQATGYGAFVLSAAA